MAEGYKAWTGGQVLDAGDLTDYASSQAVMRFANAAARDAALTASVVKEGMLAYLKDTNILTVNTDGAVTGWVQIYPVITATIGDAQVTTAKLAAGAVTPTNVSAGTYAITATNATTASNATTAINASYATNAGTVGTYATSVVTDDFTVVIRNSAGGAQAAIFEATSSSGQFASTTAYTYIGADCARVLNSSTVYDQAVSGRTVLINSNGTLGTSSSSARYKEQIQDLAFDPAVVLQLRPVSFRYKPEHLEEGSERPVEIGLIAEEVAELGLEELLYRDAEGAPSGIAYEKIAVALLKVCQTQQTQIQALAARLDALEASHAH